MKRKRLMAALIAGVTVAGVVYYFAGTKKGQAEFGRLKKTGKATADTFKTLGKDIQANIDSVRKEARANALKESFQAALEG